MHLLLPGSGTACRNSSSGKGLWSKPSNQTGIETLFYLCRELGDPRASGKSSFSLQYFVALAQCTQHTSFAIHSRHRLICTSISPERPHASAAKVTPISNYIDLLSRELGIHIVANGLWYQKQASIKNNCFHLCINLKMVLCSQLYSEGQPGPALSIISYYSFRNQSEAHCIHSAHSERAISSLPDPNSNVPHTSWERRSAWASKQMSTLLVPCQLLTSAGTAPTKGAVGAKFPLKLRGGHLYCALQLKWRSWEMVQPLFTQSSPHVAAVLLWLSKPSLVRWGSGLSLLQAHQHHPSQFRGQNAVN